MLGDVQPSGDQVGVVHLEADAGAAIIERGANTCEGTSPLSAAAAILHRSPFEGSPTKNTDGAGHGSGGRPWLPPPPLPGPGGAFNEVFMGESASAPRRVSSILKESSGSGQLPSPEGSQSRLPRNVSWQDLETGKSLQEVVEYEPSTARYSECSDDYFGRPSRCNCCIM